VSLTNVIQLQEIFVGVTVGVVVIVGVGFGVLQLSTSKYSQPIESVMETINCVDGCNNVGTVTVIGAETTPVATTEQFEYEISHMDILYGECPDKLVICITCININIKSVIDLLLVNLIYILDLN
jgi:hypothetical protein